MNKNNKKNEKRVEETLAKILNVPKPPDTSGAAGNADIYGQIIRVSLDKIRSNPNQCRSHYDVEKIESLADSLKEIGQMDPIIVRQIDDDPKYSYEVIAGERRMRATRHRGELSILAIVRKDICDLDAIIYGLVENIQKEDLNTIEKARTIAFINDALGETRKTAEKVALSLRSVERYIEINHAIKLSADFESIFRDQTNIISIRTALAFCAIADKLMSRKETDPEVYEKFIYEARRGLKGAVQSFRKSLKPVPSDSSTESGSSYFWSKRGKRFMLKLDLEVIETEERDKDCNILRNLLDTIAG